MKRRSASVVVVVAAALGAATAAALAQLAFLSGRDSPQPVGRLGSGAASLDLAAARFSDWQRGQASSSRAAQEETVCTSSTSSLFTVGAASLLAVAAVTRRAVRGARRSAPTPLRSRIPRACAPNYGEDLSVPDDAFVVLGLAHCFEQDENGKLKDAWVLEPVTASTVEVIENGSQTSYEAFIGTTAGQLLSEDVGAYPQDLLCGHEVQWGENLEYRTGCAARTWMRDHAREVVRLMAPLGEVRTGFNTCVKDKRILNFEHEVKDSDNVKQDMSIDVYDREDDAPKDTSPSIEDLYNV